MIVTEDKIYSDLPEAEARKMIAATGLNPNDFQYLPEAQWLTDFKPIAGPGWPQTSLGMDDPDED